MTHFPLGIREAGVVREHHGDTLRVQTTDNGELQFIAAAGTGVEVRVVLTPAQAQQLSTILARGVATIAGLTPGHVLQPPPSRGGLQ